MMESKTELFRTAATAFQAMLQDATVFVPVCLKKEKRYISSYYLPFPNWSVRLCESHSHSA